MRIKVNHDHIIRGPDVKFTEIAGVIDLPDAQAKAIIAAGHAVAHVNAPAPAQTAVVAPKGETAAMATKTEKVA